MSNALQFDPASFAAAYVQTMPHSKQQSDFNNEKDYLKYLESRRENYFREYLRSALYANEKLQEFKFEKPSDERK
ncbi:hypothetical protein [Corticicoccus populi]|uniref:Uncharacterized protein n=1 Tax=Corticicoccus populi TaxID=1812821 RepID=A0ABW5WU85_9STAP